ncbi:MAG TPA: rhodanese-like domain-containing protein [Gaiellaceae bacterium]|nr:rhodanese-like domain-containing protein [Gaiellaceae bacterium]
MSLDELFQRAASVIRRYFPEEAHAAVEHGAVLVDIRSSDARRRDGVIPGAVHVPRTVLEWRTEPDGEWRNPLLDGRRLILVCDHGYSSVLAAATLVGLGRDCGDVVGGFEGWAAIGLPIAAAGADPAGLPGMGGPDPQPSENK